MMAAMFLYGVCFLITSPCILGAFCIGWSLGELFHHDPVSARYRSHKSTDSTNDKSCTKMFSYLNVSYFSGIVHVIGVYSDDHLGKRKTQSIQQGVQGLSKPPDGHYSSDSLIVIDMGNTE